MPFVPAHDLVGPADAPRLAFVLHGILGSRRNWASFGRRLLERLPGWRLCLVDLRNHGDSHGAHGPHTLRACAADVVALADAVGAPDAVIGHSFGGKVALVHAREHRPAPRDVWVLDAAPGPRTGAAAIGDVERVIQAVRLLPVPAPDRNAVKAHFADLGFSPMLAGWMTTNVRPGDGGLVWRFDLDAVEQMLADYGREDLWPLLESPPEGCTLHVLRAGRSDRWDDETVARLEAAPIDTPVLEDAGHWVHVDAPDALMQLLVESLAYSA